MSGMACCMARHCKACCKGSMRGHLGQHLQGLQQQLLRGHRPLVPAAVAQQQHRSR